MSATALKAPRKPAKPRAPALLWPELPRRQEADGAAFWRAAFLRDLAQLQAGLALLNKISGTRKPARGFVYEAVHHQRVLLEVSFQYWMEDCGGLAGSVQQGGIA